MATPYLRKPRLDTTPIIAAVAVVAVAVAALLIWQNTQAQARYSTLRSGQTTGAAQRTDQTQLTCALWILLQGQASSKVTPAMRTAANRICSSVPTPVPSATK
jgi:hypothetical protein